MLNLTKTWFFKLYALKFYINYNKNRFFIILLVKSKKFYY